MIYIGCNLCRRIVASDDADAVTGGVNGKGDRVDVCGACMREAAERVAERLRALVKPADVADSMPQSIRQQALSIRLPNHLTRRRP
jgi:hypothetical protein